jgi:hypothetical protein
MHVFIKPSGVHVFVNDESYQAAIDLGWKLLEEKDEDDKPKRGRPKGSKHGNGSTDS